MIAVTSAEELLRQIKAVRLPWPEVEKGPNGEWVHAADSEWADQAEEVLEALASALERDGFMVHQVVMATTRTRDDGVTEIENKEVGTFVSKHRAQVEERAARQRAVDSGAEVISSAIFPLEVRG